MSVSREELEFITERLGPAVQKALPPGVGFCVVIYDFGEAGNMAYMANGRREDVVTMMRELGDKIASNDPDHRDLPSHRKAEG